MPPSPAVVVPVKPVPPLMTMPIEMAPEMARRNEVPSVDIEVFFEYDRSDITPDGANMLRVLGEALADPRFAGSRFVIAGHTDGRGTVAYNLALSQSRAEAVRRWIIKNYRIPPQNLIARGFGKSQFKDPANPLADQNRRVQIINWTAPAPATQPRGRR